MLGSCMARTTRDENSRVGIGSRGEGWVVGWKEAQPWLVRTMYVQHTQIYTNTSYRLRLYNILELPNILKYVPLSPDLFKVLCDDTSSLKWLPPVMGMKKGGERCWHVLYITLDQNYANGSRILYPCHVSTNAANSAPSTTQ
jgi:hypothetical protein